MAFKSEAGLLATTGGWHSMTVVTIVPLEVQNCDALPRRCIEAHIACELGAILMSVTACAE